MSKLKTAPDPLEPVKALPIADVAAAIGVTPKSVYELCRTKKLRHLRTGAKVIITAEDVREFKARNTVVPVA